VVNGSSLIPPPAGPRSWPLGVLGAVAAALCVLAALFFGAPGTDAGDDLDPADGDSLVASGVTLPSPDVPPGEMVAGWTDDDELRSGLPAVHAPDRPSFVTLSSLVSREHGARRCAAPQARQDEGRGPPAGV